MSRSLSALCFITSPGCHSQEMCCGCVTKRTKSDACPGACQVFSGAGGTEEPPQKEAVEGLIPVLSCEVGLGEAPQHLWD